MYFIIESYLDIPCGQIYLHGYADEYICKSIEFFIKTKAEKSEKKIVSEIVIKQKDIKWVYITSEGISKKVYFNSIIDYLNSLLSKLICRYSIDSNYMVLHGSACVYQDKTIIIVGEKGTGKTTLLLNSLKLGATYLCDDNIIIDENNIYPFHTAIRDKSKGNLDDLIFETYNEINYLSYENFTLCDGVAKLPCLILQPTKFKCNNQPQYCSVHKDVAYELLTKNLKSPYRTETFVLNTKILKKIFNGSLICKVDSMDLDRLYKLYNSI